MPPVSFDEQRKYSFNVAIISRVNLTHISLVLARSMHSIFLILFMCEIMISKKNEQTEVE